MSSYPATRLRRLRRTPLLRDLVRETVVRADDLIMPVFVCPGEGVAQPIAAMPGQFQFSIDRLVERIRAWSATGVRAFLLFGIPAAKDAVGSEAYADSGIVQEALRALRRSGVTACLITDVCLCEYTDHGHCGVVRRDPAGSFRVDNDASVELLARAAVSHARAGADMVAPSDMMDGRIGRIRSALDEAGLDEVPIMAYSAKFASAFYGPFREAAGSAPQFGDRRGYQMDWANAREAIREVALDVAEGADIVMVKPALAYGDIIRAVRERWDLPVAAYNVSGEYSMVKAAAARGWLDERATVREMLTGLKRAGADLIITYWAADAVQWISEGQ